MRGGGRGKGGGEGIYVVIRHWRVIARHDM